MQTELTCTLTTKALLLVLESLNLTNMKKIPLRSQLKVSVTTGEEKSVGASQHKWHQLQVDED